MDIFERVIKWVKKVLGSIRKIFKRLKKKKQPKGPFAGHSPCALAYGPEGWNDCPKPVPGLFNSSFCDPKKPNHRSHSQGKNHCYNYACNVKITSGVYADPGRGGGNPLPVFPLPFSEDEIIKALKADKIDPVDRDTPCPTCCYKIGLALWADPKSPGKYRDFHFYRHNADGTWSHKPNGQAVTNQDLAKKVISDPEKCFRFPHRKWAGYFCVCKNKIKIR